MMKRIAKAIVTALLIYLIGVPILNIAAKSILHQSVRAFGNGIIIYLLRHVVLFAAVILFYTKSFTRSFTFVGLKRPFWRPLAAGFVLSLPFTASWVVGCLFYGVPIGLSDRSVLMIVTSFLGAGLYEEALFRGLLFNEISSVVKWYTAALLTGLFFGPAHLANLIVGHNINEVLISMAAGFIVSFPMGFMFYKLERNLWACVSFHFFIAGSIDALISEELIKAHLQEITIISAVGLLLSLLLVFVLCNVRGFVRFGTGEKQPSQ